MPLLIGQSLFFIGVQKFQMDHIFQSSNFSLHFHGPPLIALKYPNFQKQVKMFKTFCENKAG